MELLDIQLEEYIKKIKNTKNLTNDLDNIKSVYPFNRYEYIIARLLAEKVLSYNEYLELRNEYIDRNLFLYVFEISAPRGFGDTWAFSHLLTVEPALQRPNKKIDPDYRGEYDLYLPRKSGNGIIKIEVKASRAVNRDRADEPLYIKALSSNGKASFLMNFQQLKPSCCDVFMWLAVYRDCVKYWVFNSNFVRKHRDFTPQHRNETTAKRNSDYKKAEIYEGQIMITNGNISSLEKYSVQGREILQAILNESGK